MAVVERLFGQLGRTLVAVAVYGEVANVESLKQE